MCHKAISGQLGDSDGHHSQGTRLKQQLPCSDITHPLGSCASVKCSILAEEMSFAYKVVRKPVPVPLSHRAVHSCCGQAEELKVSEGTCAYPHIPMVTCLLPLGCKEQGPPYLVPCCLLSTLDSAWRSRCSRLIVCPNWMCVCSKAHTSVDWPWWLLYLQCLVSSGMLPWNSRTILTSDMMLLS